MITKTNAPIPAKEDRGVTEVDLRRTLETATWLRQDVVP